MATVKAKFRPSPCDSSKGKIYLQITHEKQTRTIATNHIVNTSDWNQRRISMAITISHLQYGGNTTELQADINRLKIIAARMDTSGLNYTSSDIVEEYNLHLARFSLVNFMSARINDLQSKGKLRTAQNYRSTLKSFMTFREDKDIMIDALSAEIIEHYESYLLSRTLKPNTTSFYMRILRAVCNFAIEKGALLQSRPFRHVYTGIGKTKKRALSLHSMKKLYALDLSNSPALEYARDIFILSFLTRGMSFIDMAFLLKTNLQNGYITYRRHKTGQTLTIRWTREMQHIIDKYSPNTTVYLFPILRNPKSNPVYAYRNISYKINRDLKQIASISGMPAHFTLYCARHTWASIAQSQGIPISIISQGMGHDSERTTQIYLSSLDTSLIDRANDKVISSIF